jgi:hypothetical protein
LSDVQAPGLGIATVTGIAIDAQERVASRPGICIGTSTHRFFSREISGRLIHVPSQRAHLPDLCSLYLSNWKPLFAAACRSDDRRQRLRAQRA